MVRSLPKVRQLLATVDQNVEVARITPPYLIERNSGWLWTHCVQVQLIALAGASWRFPSVVRLALFSCGEPKCAGANWCQVSLHCQLRITATITPDGIQCRMPVYRMEWSDTVPFLPRYTVAYLCIPW